MVARLAIDLQDGETLAVIRRAAAQLADPGPMLDNIGRRLAASTMHRFEQGAGPDGVRWKPSARARKQSGQTLVDSGRLRDSITHVVRGDELLVGTNVEYAGIHQFGGTIRQQARTQVLAFQAAGRLFASRRSTRRRRAGAVRIAIAAIGAREINMPARPFLGLSAGDEQAISRIALRYLGEPFS